MRSRLDSEASTSRDRFEIDLELHTVNFISSIKGALCLMLTKAPSICFSIHFIVFSSHKSWSMVNKSYI
jgi:hypothetical protein